MSEVVVQFTSSEFADSVRLTTALDAFAKWTEQTGLFRDDADAPEIMMITEHLGAQVRRKLVFQDRTYAARFLMFWRSERNGLGAASRVVVYS